MSLASYTDLKTGLANWSHRSDLTARMDEFITLAESRLNRLLRVKQMEASLATTALASGAITNPTGFLAWKELRYDGSPAFTLQPAPLEWILNQPSLSDIPNYFAVNSTQTLCWPQAGNVIGTYYVTIPTLVAGANSTNWLMTNYPGVYLYACLEELGLFTQNPNTPSWQQRAQMLIEQLQSADNANVIGGGPLTARAR